MTIGEVAVLINGNSSGLEKEAIKATASLQKVADKAKEAGEGLKKMGEKGMVFVTLPIVAALTASTKAFIDFNGALNKSMTFFTEATTSMKAEAGSLARELALKTSFSAKELASNYTIMGREGFTAASAMATMKTAAQFSQVSTMELADGTSMLIDVLDVLGMKAKDTATLVGNMARVSDVLTKAGRTSGATAQQYGEALEAGAGAAARVLGQDLESVVAVLMAFEDQGIKGAEAGGQYALMLRGLQKAAIENKAQFAQLGITVFDAQGKLLPFATILSQISTSLAGSSDEYRKNALNVLGFNERIVGTVTAMMGSSAAIRQNEEALRKAGGTTQSVADQQMKGLTMQMDLLKKQFIDMAIGVGGTFIPMIQQVMAKINEWVTWWKGLTEAQRQHYVDMALWAAAVPVVLVAIGKLLIGLASLIKAFRTMTIFFAANPIVAFVTTLLAAAAAVYGLVKAYKAWQDARGKEKETAAALAEQNALMEKQGTSLAKIREENRKRWADTKAMPQTPAAAAAAAPAAAAARKALPYLQNKEDISAEKAYNDMLAQTVNKNLKDYEKFNELLVRHAKLQGDIAKAQAGSKEYYEMKAKAVTVESEMNDYIKTQKERLTEVREQFMQMATTGAMDMTKAAEMSKALGLQFKAKDFSSTGGAAVEKGSVEEYRLRINAAKRDKVEEWTKKAAEGIQKLIDATEVNGNNLADALKASKAEVVSI